MFGRLVLERLFDAVSFLSLCDTADLDSAIKLVALYLYNLLSWSRKHANCVEGPDTLGGCLASPCTWKIISQHPAANTPQLAC